MKMDFQLRNGVNLHVIPTKKFTMTRIVINFSTPQTVENAVIRNLLANILVSGSANYPNQTMLARKLASLYGAYLDAYVARVGIMHTLRITTTFVNDQIVGDNIQDEVIRLLNEIIFNPLINSNQFDQKTWQVQRNNLNSTLQSWRDDKQYYAAGQLDKLYFTDPAMKEPSSGTITQLKSVSNEETFLEYQRMIKEDPVDICVIGDVSPKHIINLIKGLPFKSRYLLDGDVLYHQKINQLVRKRVESQGINQAKLNLTYALPVYFSDNDYLAGVVMNDFLGGTVYSLLFSNVREKHGLAYYANSTLMPFSGHLTVQTGIDNHNFEQVLKLINQQVKDIQDGIFTDERLESVKKSLVNQVRLAKDSLTQQLERQLIHNLLDFPFTNTVTDIENINKKQIIEVAQKMKLQAIFLLE